MAAGRAVAGEGLTRAGREQDREVPVASEKPCPRQREQRSRREGLPADRPVLAQGDQQVLAPGAEADVLRQVEPLELPLASEEVLRGEKGGAAPRELAPEAGLEGGVDRGADVGGLALEDQRGLRQRRAAAPEAGLPGVARVGEAAGAEVRPDVEVVAVAPGDLSLRLGQLETVGHERLGHRVELPHHDRVGAAAR